MTGKIRPFFRDVLTALVLLLALPADASGSGLLSFVEHQADIPIEEPEDIVLAPDERHVYVVGSSALAVFERDPVTGLPTLLEVHFEGRSGVAGLRRASSLALSGDGRFVYAASPQHPGADGVDRGAVAIFERDRAAGTLRFVDVHSEGFEGVTERFGSANAVLSPGDTHLYVASSPDRAVLVFERHPATGALRFAGAAREAFDGGACRLFAALDPEGRHLYLTNLCRGSVTVFRRNRTTGILRFVEDLMSEDPDYEMVFPVFPGGVSVSPDGRHVYVTNTRTFPFDSDDGRALLMNIPTGLSFPGSTGG